MEGVKFTRSRKKDSMSEQHSSAITDHVASMNHTVDWEKTKLPAKESDWTRRGIREAILIKKAGTNVMNRDGGRHLLPEVYSDLLCAAPPSVRAQKH